MATAAKDDDEDMDIPEEAAQLDEHRQYGHGTLTEKDLDEKYVRDQMVFASLLTISLEVSGPATQPLPNAAIPRSVSDAFQPTQ